VPEELAAGELGDDRRAVQDYEAAVCDAYVEFMNQTSYQLFAGPAFADQEHGSIGEPRDLNDLTQHRAPSRTSTDELRLD
jgi:hypothetical protein